MEHLKHAEGILGGVMDIFFNQLPEPSDVPYRVDRSSVDRLVEQGISLEMLLNEFVHRGYLLHGSKRMNISLLEPRQANDEGDKGKDMEENNRNAVYTSNDPRIPLFMALPKRGESGYSIDGFIGDDGVVTESTVFYAESIDTERTGSVYVVPSKNFEWAGGSQYTSTKSVVPSYEISVNLSDFQYPIEKENNRLTV